MTARALMTGIVIVLIFGGILGVFSLGVNASLRGDVSWGALFQFAFLSIMAAGSVGALGETWGDVQKAAGAMERVGELLDARLIQSGQRHLLLRMPWATHGCDFNFSGP